MTGPRGHQWSGRVTRCAVLGSDEGDVRKADTGRDGSQAVRIPSYSVHSGEPASCFCLYGPFSHRDCRKGKKPQTYGRVNVPD